MEDQVESREAQEGLAVKFESFSDLCAVISKEIDRGNNNHQIFIRFLESILFEIKSETKKITSIGNAKIENITEFENKIMAKAIINCLSEIKDMVQDALIEILSEKSEFKNKLENEWLPQIKKIFLGALRLELKEEKEYKDRNEEEWLIPLIYFLSESSHKDQKRPQPSVSLPVILSAVQPAGDSASPRRANRADDRLSASHPRLVAPSSPKETIISPKKQERSGRKVTFDFQAYPENGSSLPHGFHHEYPLAKKGADTSKTELKGAVNSAAVSREDRNSQPRRGKIASVDGAAAPPTSPVIAEKDQTQSNKAPAPNQKSRRVSLPHRFTNFVQRFRKGPDDDDSPGPTADTSKSI